MEIKNRTYWLKWGNMVYFVRMSSIELPTWPLTIKTAILNYKSWYIGLNALNWLITYYNIVELYLGCKI